MGDSLFGLVRGFWCTLSERVKFAPRCCRFYGGMTTSRPDAGDPNLEAARTLLRAAGYEEEAIEGAFFVLCSGTDREAVSDEMLSARDVCDLIGISLSTLWRWEIPHVRVGGLRRFYRSDIDKFLNRRYVRARK